MSDNMILLIPPGIPEDPHLSQVARLRAINAELVEALALAIATIPIRERAWEEGAAAGWKMIGLFHLERAVTLP